jgi:hypothetical protein
VFGREDDGVVMLLIGVLSFIEPFLRVEVFLVRRIAKAIGQVESVSVRERLTQCFQVCEICAVPFPTPTAFAPA